MEPPRAMQSSRMSLGEFFGGVFLAGDAAVVEDERMEVAVAGVKDVGDAQAAGLAQAFDFAR